MTFTEKALMWGAYLGIGLGILYVIEGSTMVGFGLIIVGALFVFSFQKQP